MISVIKQKGKKSMKKQTNKQTKTKLFFGLFEHDILSLYDLIYRQGT